MALEEFGWDDHIFTNEILWIFANICGVHESEVALMNILQEYDLARIFLESFYIKNPSIAEISILGLNNMIIKSKILRDYLIENDIVDRIFTFIAFFDDNNKEILIQNEFQLFFDYFFDFIIEFCRIQPVLDISEYINF